MSKQAIAKITQAYEEKPLAPQCGNCKHFEFAMRLPAWMRRENAESGQERYKAERDGVVSDVHCGIGGFKVKKTGTCQLFQWKENKE